MIKTHAMMIEELKDYRAPENKLGRLVKQGSCVPIVRGLYETDKLIPGYLDHRICLLILHFRDMD